MEDKIQKLFEKQLTKNSFIPLVLDELTNHLPLKIKQIRIFRVSDKNRQDEDPVPVSNWIVVSDKKLFSGEKMIDALKEIGFVAKSKKESLNAAKLILFSERNSARIYPDFDGDNSLQIKKWELSAPVVKEQEGCYEIILDVFVPMGEWETDSGQIFRYWIKIGKGVYERVKEKNAR